MAERTLKWLNGLSLSRLSRWLPWGQTHPEMVQGTADLHHESADARLPQAAPVFHHATTLDAAVDMLDPQPPLVERLVGQVVLPGQLRTAGLSLPLQSCKLFFSGSGSPRYGSIRKTILT